jgi:hypothetical protein
VPGPGMKDEKAEAQKLEGPATMASLDQSSGSIS